MLENEIWKCGRNLPLTTFGSGRVKSQSDLTWMSDTADRLGKA